MTHPGPDRLVGVSLKMYLDLEQTRRWLAGIAALGRQWRSAAPGSRRHRVEVFVLPGYLSLTDAGDLLAGSAIRYGAQDVSSEARGPFTGEVAAEDLRALGCTVAELGHAERRRLFGEDDAGTAAKAAACLRSGLLPVVCVGEVSRGTAADAVARCRPQVAAVLDAVPDHADLVFAYEPVWAIGAAEPAGADHVVAVIDGLREMVAGRSGTVRFLYGGSAGPGTYGRLAGAVDGLFLGRFAHDLDALAAVVAEIAS